MSAELNKAAMVVSPLGDGTNNSNVMAIGVSTTAGAAEMPSDWHDAHVTLKMIGADVYWFFQESATAPTGSALPDSSVGSSAPATGERDPQMGWPLRDGEVSPERVPVLEVITNKVYLCHDGSGDGILWLHKSSPQ